MIYLRNHLSPSSLKLLDKAQAIAREVIAPKAVEWDRDARFPYEMFQAMHSEKLDALTIPKALGGLEIGPDGGEPLALWLITKTLATADSSASQCQQLHNNTALAIKLLGTPEQQERYLRPVVEQGAILGAWGAEGHSKTSTVAQRVSGGYQITGTKMFATNAGAARYAAVVAFPEGSRDPNADMMFCMVDCQAPGVTVKPQWWESATGMRATWSHEVRLDRVFVADEAILGPPGGYLGLQIQARVLPQFSANFQGVGAHVFEFGLDYLRTRERTGDAFIQHHIAEAQTLLVSAEMMLGRTAELYAARDYPEAFHYSRMVRAYSEMSINRVVQLVQNCCGSSVYLEPSPLARILRDWHFYSRHENLDLILSQIGKTIFQLGGETSFEAFGFRDNFRSGAGAEQSAK
ncbi:MAG: acyl-CoA/acyl-ACP dehydrogenase [Candidatus Binataceae bacterium]|nr:acyl-CoA/acyl-ACP dehydrogenase [Candidatus Binataceae bacterium]